MRRCAEARELLERFAEVARREDAVSLTAGALRWDVNLVGVRLGDCRAARDFLDEGIPKAPADDQGD